MLQKLARVLIKAAGLTDSELERMIRSAFEREGCTVIRVAIEKGKVLVDFEGSLTLDL